MKILFWFGKFLAVAVLKQFLEVRQCLSPSVMSIFSQVQLLIQVMMYHKHLYSPSICASLDELEYSVSLFS